MATKKRDELKRCFSRGKYPTGSQFGDLIDSFVHQNEDKIRIAGVEGLAEQLNAKYSKAEGMQLAQQAEELARGFHLQQQVISDLKSDVTSLGRRLVNINELCGREEQFESEWDAFAALSRTYTGRWLPAGSIAVFHAEDCWYRWLYKGAPAEDEGEAEAAAVDEDTDDAAQVAVDSPQRVAPIPPDKNVANPDNWVRLPDLTELEDLEVLLDQLSNAPTVELTADEMAAMLPHDDSAVATLELDADTAPVAKAPAAPAASPALERFRTRFREMLERSRRRTAALSKSTESTEPSNTDNDNER